MRLPKVLLLLLLSFAVASAPADAALRAPALVAPSNDAVVEASPAFTWGAVKGAAIYEFQLAADREFGAIVLGRGRGKGTFTTKNTAGTLSGTLPNGTYYWRVRAIDSKDRASKWSNIRTFDKSWATAPTLIGPIDALSVTWPAIPLVLEWSVVPYAVNYIVTIATDPALSSQVLGSTASPQKTRGNVFALPGSLAPGQYYWAITPLDADGHPGKRSRVGTFTWSWPSQTTARFTDLNPDPRVLDPEFSWDPVPGAARYEVEINPDSDFAAGSEVCCNDLRIGTSLSPTTVLADNTYYWRVRAFDVDGNAGVWNNGPTFTKNFDAEAGQPTIRNLRVRDTVNDPAPKLNPTDLYRTTNSPILVWDPVPGASGYEVQLFDTTPASPPAPPGTLVCDHASKLVDDFTATSAWTPLTASGPGNVGPASWGLPHGQGQDGLFPVSGTLTYCASVRAYTGRPGGLSGLNGYISQPTEYNFALSPFKQCGDGRDNDGDGNVDFPADVDCTSATDDDEATVPTTPATPLSGDYLAPVSATTPRMPIFMWNAIPNAKSYVVVVARDPDFIHVVDHLYTRIPAYAPRANGPITYEDETTDYYWSIIPYNPTAAPTIPTGTPPPGQHAAFKKQSVPPTLLSPVGGADTLAQPRFNWTPAEGARSYTLQVSQDPTFGDPIDNVTTGSTSYTSSSTYPADTVMYWRVRANDETSTGLTWSATGTFTRRLPVPSPASGNPTGGERIPVLAWTPVTGAISYDMHVDKTGGDTQDINTRSTSFTPTQFYGNGIWRWRVRANFPTTGGAKVSGGYFEPQSYVRKIGPTPNVHGTRTKGRYLLSWDPDPAATNYRVEISSSNGFTRSIESARLKTTDYAPGLTSTAYDAGGNIYWRVASAEDGNNVGAYTTGIFVLPKGIKIKLTGGLIRRVRRTVTITLTDSKGTRIRSALVRVSGAGVRRTRKRTGKRGTARFSLRPTRPGTVTFTVTRSGYRDATKSVTIR